MISLPALGRLALAGATLLASLATHAAIVTHGALTTQDDGTNNIITDSLNNVEYLRLNVLADRTYLETVALLGTQDGGGWSIADSTVALNFVQALLSPLPSLCAHDGTSTVIGTCGVVPLWADGDMGPNYHAPDDAAWFLDDSGQADYINITSSGAVTLVDFTLASSDNFSHSGQFSTLPISWLLVRSAEVPVPAAGWLFMSALLGLAGKKQLSRR